MQTRDFENEQHNKNKKKNGNTKRYFFESLKKTLKVNKIGLEWPTKPLMEINTLNVGWRRSLTSNLLQGVVIIKT